MRISQYTDRQIHHGQSQEIIYKSNYYYVMISDLLDPRTTNRFFLSLISTVLVPPFSSTRRTCDPRNIKELKILQSIQLPPSNAPLQRACGQSKPDYCHRMSGTYVELCPMLELTNPRTISRRFLRLGQYVISSTC